MSELSEHRFEHRRALLCRDGMAVLREGHLGEVYAIRGTGKTWFIGTLALAAATGTDALGFSAPAPCRVLWIDGEMASEEIQGRVEGLRERLNLLNTENLTIVAADWQDGFLPRLDTAAGQAAVEAHVAPADLVILDNRSSLFDPESEKDPTAWQPAQDWLLSLRRRGKAVLIVHHSNRQGGARGHSKPEDVMDLLISLTRPDDHRADEGARFRVEFPKARGVYGSAVAPFEAQLTAAGWLVQSDRPESTTTEQRLIEYLRLADEANERPRSASAALRGAHVQKAQGLKAWAELLKQGRIEKRTDGTFGLVGQ
jgi:putative DNA primase/helicase